MAKGMNKRKEVKKAKKEVTKPGTVVVAKNAVQTTTSKIKE